MINENRLDFLIAPFQGLIYGSSKDNN